MGIFCDCKKEFERQKIREKLTVYKNTLMDKNICLTCSNRNKMGSMLPEWSNEKNYALTPHVATVKSFFICRIRESLDKYASNDNAMILVNCPFYEERIL